VPALFGCFPPHCPACRARGAITPLHLAAWHDAGQGILTCPAEECASRYPIIDGLPVLVPDLSRYLAEVGVYLLARDDLWAPVADLVGSVTPPGAWFDAARQHLSGYVRDHWGAFDPSDREPPSPGQAWALAKAGLALIGEVTGPVIELGAAAGGVTRALAERLDMPVLGLDLSAPVMRFAARALRGGTLRYPLRMSGTAYAEREIVVPPPERGEPSVWLADALAPPVAEACAGLVVALNLLDCVSDPAALMRAAAGLLRPGGYLLLCTPRDWNASATPVDAWVGARSAEAAAADLGAWAEHVSRLELMARVEDQGWEVRVHSRATMHYRSDLLVLRRRT
jgi:SAM-dependent methyltransferase